MVLPQSCTWLLLTYYFREGVYRPLSCAPTDFVHLPVLGEGQRCGLPSMCLGALSHCACTQRLILRNLSLSLQQHHTVLPCCLSFRTIDTTWGSFPIRSIICLSVGFLNSLTSMELHTCLGVSWPFWCLLVPPFFLFPAICTVLSPLLSLHYHLCVIFCSCSAFCCPCTTVSSDQAGHPCRSACAQMSRHVFMLTSRVICVIVCEMHLQHWRCNAFSWETAISYVRVSVEEPRGACQEYCLVVPSEIP